MFGKKSEPAKIEPSFVKSSSADDSLKFAPVNPDETALNLETVAKEVAVAATVAVVASAVAGAVSTPALPAHKVAWGWFTRHERALSGVGMIGGFGFDSYSFRRIDLPNTQILFIAYLTVSAVAILWLHRMIARQEQGKPMPKWHSILPMAAQFALGGMWSAFLVFYTRGAVFASAWPYLLVLVAIFIGNEVFKHYHSRLVFTAILFFFGLYSYAIVTAPILTRNIGNFTFLFAGIAALGIFLIFARAIRAMGMRQWREARAPIAGGVIAVYAVLNLFYFTGVLPPLPLALADSGVYHAVAKKGDVYQAQGETQPWFTRFGAAPVLHLAQGEGIYVYSAVFAPIKLSTRIVHRWQHYDAIQRKWRTVSKVAYAINGGRDGGYRGYTLTHHVASGDWRVDVDTPDGHIIGRVRFSVEMIPKAIPLVVQTLR
jgi:hypothetical protein